MATLSTSALRGSSVRNLFERLFALNLSNSQEYSVTVLDGAAFGEVEKTLSVKSNDGPAALVLNLLRENPALAGKRVWIHDPTLNNRFPHRFRLMIDADGNPRARLIEPRRR
jgi:fructose-specific component phosphotransferase system IIB-like protein